MSTHNICFSREIRKILCGYPFLSVAMIAGIRQKGFFPTIHYPQFLTFDHGFYNRQILEKM